MERECFEDAEVASAINDGFICIKVDKEERPDVDAVYVSAVQMMSGGNGGWPMSVFIDADGNPFFAGTYFPKHDGRHGSGFLSIVNGVSELWREDRNRCLEAAKQALSGLAERNTTKEIGFNIAAEKGYHRLAASFDKEYGGFGKSPKFPAPHNLMFLMRYYNAKTEPHALEMADKTLRAMYAGGLNDHIGYGFCRYSTNREWLVPHFEKMLYDNALLAMAYAEAFLATGDDFHKKAAQEILSYIKRDMTDPSGGFYSAEDADSEGEEGKFYLFTRAEVLDVLGKDGERFCEVYNITENGNFEGANIPNLIRSVNTEELTDCLKRLYAYREKRPRPFKDDKIIASWNGLMIAAFAYCGRVFNDLEYIEAARVAASFVLTNLSDENGRLRTIYRDGAAGSTVVADDYACVIWGLLELYAATYEKTHLLEAQRLNSILTEDFWEAGALRISPVNQVKPLISNPRDLYDGAIPSANSISMYNFLRLGYLCDDQKLLEMTAEIARFFGADLEQAPHAHCYALCSLMHISGATRRIIITGPDPSPFISYLNSSYQPFAIAAYSGHDYDKNDLAKDFDVYRHYTSSRPAAFVCENNVCRPPVYSPDEM